LPPLLACFGFKRWEEEERKEKRMRHFSSGDLFRCSLALETMTFREGKPPPGREIFWDQIEEDKRDASTNI